VHGWTDETERFADALLEFARNRLRASPPPLGGSLAPQQLREQAGTTITPEGLGAGEAFRVFREVIAPAAVSVDHPRFLAFIPGAPTELAALFDLAVSVSSIYGGTWMEASGAVHAENQALRWIADLAGFPQTAGGCFVSGGTGGNLSALVAARHTALERRGGRPERWALAASTEAHSSVAAAARVMDVDVLAIEVDERFRMTGETLSAALEAHDADRVFAVVASAGTTNLGVVDDFAGLSAVCAEHGLWLHVDGAYGAAALAAPSVRGVFAGIERADSLIVDPHKWLFGPFDCCALLYREPELARRAHTQQAGYLDAIAARDEWNASDYAVHLSRRVRGLPLWFSLAAHGTRAYERAIESVLGVARAAAHEIDRRPYLERVHDPVLSVVAFRRLGWAPPDYERWSEELLATGNALVTPTKHRGETITRFAFVNPRTTVEDVRGILDTMA
jgi:glutamate/tyrosine decarboxylase-like PLP-dependent enzyme